MKFNPNKSTFGRHETFPLRYGWLTKGVQAISQHPRIFKETEHAMTVLGLGSNMVNALQYWLQATGIAKITDGEAQVTSLGEALLGDQGDPYLEDEATLWIIHWLIASNAEQATGFFWFFNDFAMPRFKSEEALKALVDFVKQELQGRSESTLKSEISTLLRMYAPNAGRLDEHLDSPFALLQLIENDAGAGYVSLRSLRPFFPAIALHCALQQRFAAQQQEAIPFRALLYGGDGYAAPGSVFRLNEEGLMKALDNVMSRYPDYYELRETAGLQQLYSIKPAMTVKDLLIAYYQGMDV